MGKNRKKPAVRVGNWRTKQTWSLEAKRKESFAVFAFAGTHIAASDYAWANGFAYYYRDSSARVGHLAKTLFEDVYADTLERLPVSVKDNLLAQNWMVKEMADAIVRALKEIGDTDIIFAGGDEEIDPELTLAAQPVNSDRSVLLSPRPVGMPVKDFLIWQKGCETPAHVLAEWSGVPRRKQRFVYQTIIKLLGEIIAYNNQQTEKYSVVKTGIMIVNT